MTLQSRARDVRGQTLTQRIAPWVVPVLILCPGLAWLALDRAVWPWDQAWYGAHALTLYEALRQDAWAWLGALTRATPWKPPALVWIGQFFVPLGVGTGAVDAALRLSVWATSALALILLFRAFMAWSGGSTLVSCAGTLVAGAAPIFITLSTQFLVEAVQTLAVAWFVLIMVRAPQWRRSVLAAQLLAATSFAMLAKTTSPLYCAAPGIVALAWVVRRRPGTAPEQGRFAVWASWALALVLTAGAAAWYARNLDATLRAASMAAFGPVAELYGERATFLQGLNHWCITTMQVTFVRPMAALLSILVVAAAVRWVLAARGSGVGHRDLCAGAALVQVALALVTFPLSPNRDARYAAPLLPLMAVLVCQALVVIGRRWVAGAIVATLAVQLALVQSQVLGLWPGRPAVLRADLILADLTVLHRDPRPAANLQAIVHRTCGQRGFGAYNFVGVDVLDLSGHSLTYAAAKERLAGRAGQCRYDSAGFTALDVMRRVDTQPYVYWISLDSSIRPVPDDFLNQSAPIVFRQLRRRGILQPEPWQGPDGVLLFRFARR